VEGIVLDLDQLDAANRTLVDAGQCPPVLRVWWLEHLQEDLGAMLYRFIPTRHFWDQISAELVPLTPQLLLAEIQEDIRRIELPMGEFMERCKTGGFQDAKLIIAGLWCCAREMKT
jgi:hypothetical protein